MVHRWRHVTPVGRGALTIHNAVDLGGVDLKKDQDTVVKGPWRRGRSLSRKTLADQPSDSPPPIYKHQSAMWGWPRDSIACGCLLEENAQGKLPFDLAMPIHRNKFDPIPFGICI